METRYVIRRGDQCLIPFYVMYGTSAYYLQPAQIDEIEAVFGELTKKLSTSEILFDTTTGQFQFPLTEAETFDLFAGEVIRSQIRVKLKTVTTGQLASIFSFNGPVLNIIESKSEEIL